MMKYIARIVAVSSLTVSITTVFAQSWRGYLQIKMSDVSCG